MSKTRKRVVGIDPGKTGAFGTAGYKDNVVHDLPLLAVHSKALVDVVQFRAALVELDPDLIVIEHQGVRPKQGVSSSGQTMFMYGGLLATCLTLGKPVEVVNAGKWKRLAGLNGKSKEYSRKKALRHFPSLLPRLKRKKDHNRAEALLLARFGQSLH